jgi:hypothetical protein
VPVPVTKHQGEADTPSAAENPDRKSEPRDRGEDTCPPTAGFQAIVQIFDVRETDASAARRTVEERLQRAGFGRWQLVSLYPHPVAMPARRHRQRRPTRRGVSYANGGLLLAAIVAWALWFIWLLTG